MSTTVSIIEDDVPAREILADWIRRAEGFQCVSEYENAEDAMEALPREKPAVVLVDINLPGMNGIECIRRLKPVLPLTQFVMLTVYEDDNHIFRALAAGASGYLLKQTPASDVVDRLERGLRRRLADEQQYRPESGAVFLPAGGRLRRWGQSFTT